MEHHVFVTRQLNNQQEAVDVMEYCWKGQWPEKRAPSIMKIKLNGGNWQKNHVFIKNEEVNLEFIYNKNNNDSLYFDFQLYPETFSTKGGGDVQKSPDKLEFEKIKQTENTMTFKVPNKKGFYRIFVFIRNEINQTSVANIPFKVEAL